MRRVVVASVLALLCAGPQLWAARAEGAFERILNVSGPVQLRVGTGSGSISIRKGAEPVVRIRARVVANDRWGGRDAKEVVREIEQNPPIQQTGNIITVGNEVRRWENVGISYDIAVPDETQVNAHTGSGNVDAYDVKGPAELGTGSGSIHAENIPGRVAASTGSGNVTVTRAGETKARTGSGSIEIAQIAGGVDANTGSGNVTVASATGAVHAEAGSGQVRIEGAKADVEAHSGSGGLTVDGTPKAAHWNLRSGSGGVNVTLPPGTAFEVDAHTGSGSISTSHPVTVSGTVRRNELRGVAVRSDNRLLIRTGSGNVRID